MELSLAASVTTLIIGVIPGRLDIKEGTRLVIAGRVDTVLIIDVMYGYLGIKVCNGQLDIMTGTELTFAAPCLDFEVYSGVLGLSESRPLSLLLDIVLMFTTVHLVMAHVLLCEGLLEKHRFIVTELQTNSIF